MKVYALNYQNPIGKTPIYFRKAASAQNEKNQQQIPTEMDFDNLAYDRDFYNYQKQYAIISPIKTNNTAILNSEISFGGEITKQQRKDCHAVIHSASAICAGISATLGEGAAIGADTILLRGVQAVMFLLLQQILNVDIPASIMYAYRQYMMGEYLGLRGAQTLISWLGIGGHGLSGGTASAPITAAVRSVNASLSTLLTEKMGWGYVKSYEQDSMTLLRQTILTGAYGILSSHFDIDNSNQLDPSNPHDIKKVLDRLSKEDLTTYGHIMHTLSNTVDIPRAGQIFTLSMIQGLLTTKKMDNVSREEYLKNLVKMALLKSVLFEIINTPEDQIIKEHAVEAVHNLKSHFENTPEAFQEFMKTEKNLIDKLELDKFDSVSFVKKFRDPKYLINVAFFTSEATDILANSWRKRNIGILKENNAQIAARAKKANEYSHILNGKLSENDKEKLNQELNTIIQRTTQEYINKSRAHNAFSRIAGYDGTKALLNISYIDAIKKENTENLPNVILFYGPSGVGKSAIGIAVAEAAGVKFRSKNLGMGDETKTLDWIKNQLEIAKTNYATQKRYSIIQLNEFDDFLNENPEKLDEFVNLVNDCAKKYHTTIFLTTNNPLSINKEILNKVDIPIPMGAATKNDIKNIVTYYINNREIPRLDIDEITKEFEKVKPNNAYSNSQIENIFTQIVPSIENCNQKDILEIIQHMKPCISKEINEKFAKEQTILQKGEK